MTISTRNRDGPLLTSQFRAGRAKMYRNQKIRPQAWEFYGSRPTSTHPARFAAARTTIAALRRPSGLARQRPQLLRLGAALAALILKRGMKPPVRTGIARQLDFAGRKRLVDPRRPVSFEPDAALSLRPHLRTRKLLCSIGQPAGIPRGIV